MDRLDLHKEYGIDEALAALGLTDAAVQCHDWRIGDDCAALLATFGAWPAQTHLTGGRTLCWRAPGHCGSVPPIPVRAGSSLDLHAFAVGLHGRATYLGPLRPAYSWSHPSPGRSHGGSTHTLVHHATPELWSSLDSTRYLPQLAHVAELDAVVDEAMREGNTRGLLALVRHLHGIDAVLLPTRIENGLPRLLSEFHHQVGGRHQVHSAQNRLIPLDELAADADGHITFYVENQGVYLWSLRSGEVGADDPVVYGQYNGDEPWQPEMPLSAFLATVILVEYVMQAPYGGSSAAIDAPTMDEIARRLPRLGLQPWRFPSPGTALHAAGGVVAQVASHAPHGKGFGIFLGCSRPEPLQWLGDLVEDWDHRDF